MDCYSGTGHSGQLVFPQEVVDKLLEYFEEGTMIYVLGPGGDSGGAEECAGSGQLEKEPFAIAIWGYDTIAEEKNGLYQGDPWDVVIVDDEGDQHLLSLVLRDTGPPYLGEQLYMDNGIYVIEQLAVETQGEITSIDFLNQQQIADYGAGADVVVGIDHQEDMVGLELELDTTAEFESATFPGEGEHVYQLAAAHGEQIRVVCLFADDPIAKGDVWPITLHVSSPTGGSTVNLVNGEVLRMTAEGGPERVPVTISETVVQIMKVLRGDVTGNGDVGTEDLLAIMKHLVWIARLQDEQRPAADLYPYAEGGNEKVDIRDAWVLARAICKSEWPDGTPLTDEPDDDE